MKGLERRLLDTADELGSNTFTKHKGVVLVEQQNTTLLELRDVIDRIARTMLEYLGADGCNYNTIHKDSISVSHTIYNKMGMPQGNYRLSNYPKLRLLLEKGEVFSIEDVNNTDQLDENLKFSLVENRIVSCLVAPIIKNGQVVGFLVLSQTEPRKWLKEEKKLIKDVSLLIWSLTEIEENKKEKEKLIRQLREKEEWLSAIMDCMDASLWARNTLGETTLIAGRDREIFQSEFYGKSPLDLSNHLDFYSIDGKPVKLDDISFDGPSNGQTVISQGIVHNKKTDELMYRQTRTSPIKNKDGEIVGSVVISFDIEEQVKIEKTLMECNKRSLELIHKLKEQDEIKRGFLSFLSHELRNPLATIALALDFMDYTEDDIEEQRETRETLKRQTKQLIRLVDDLLNMTRITQNKLDMNLESLQVNTLLEEAIKDNISVFNDKGVILKGSIAQEEILIEGDKIRLRQAIDNILSNSLKFTPGGGRVAITLEKDKSNKQALISIKDTGTGIPADILENIFKPYIQARNNQGESPVGLGLGLSIVKDIIDRHGGTIKAVSEGEDMGTEMLIRLPLQA